MRAYVHRSRSVADFVGVDRDWYYSQSLNTRGIGTARSQPDSDRSVAARGHGTSGLNGVELRSDYSQNLDKLWSPVAESLAAVSEPDFDQNQVKP